jgi:hypothetical protein
MFPKKYPVLNEITGPCSTTEKSIEKLKMHVQPSKVAKCITDSGDPTHLEDSASLPLPNRTISQPSQISNRSIGTQTQCQSEQRPTQPQNVSGSISPGPTPSPQTPPPDFDVHHENTIPAPSSRDQNLNFRTYLRLQQENNSFILKQLQTSLFENMKTFSQMQSQQNQSQTRLVVEQYNRLSTDTIKSQKVIFEHAQNVSKVVTQNSNAIVHILKSTIQTLFSTSFFSD